MAAWLAVAGLPLIAAQHVSAESRVRKVPSLPLAQRFAAASSVLLGEVEEVHPSSTDRQGNEWWQPDDYGKAATVKVLEAIKGKNVARIEVFFSWRYEGDPDPELQVGKRYLFLLRPHRSGWRLFAGPESALSETGRDSYFDPHTRHVVDLRTCRRLARRTKGQ